MRTLYFIFIFTGVLLFSDCNNEKSDVQSKEQIADSIARQKAYKEKEKRYKEYTLKTIDSLQLQNICDETKWRLYCLFCDHLIKDTCHWGKITYGMLEAHFFDCTVMGDSADISYYFTEPPNFHKGLYVDNWGGAYVFRLPSKRLIWFESWHGLDMDLSADTTGLGEWISENFLKMNKVEREVFSFDMRIRNPLQREVIEFIKANKNKLNPWFRNEAIKRGIITN